MPMGPDPTAWPHCVSAPYCRPAVLLRGGLARATAAALRRAQALGGALQRALGVEAGTLLGDQLVAARRLLAQAPQHAAGAGRNQPADDHVLLEAIERIGLAVDGGVGQHTGGLLEGGRGDEA